MEARDQGHPRLTGTTTVLVTVLDKNDNPPQFTRLFSVNVTENAEIGTFVIRITSSDLDIGQNANVSYSFTVNPGEKFSINALSGNVTVTGHLDREEQDEYLLKVEDLIFNITYINEKSIIFYFNKIKIKGNNIFIEKRLSQNFK